LFAAVVVTTFGAVGLGIVGIVATFGALLGGGAVVQTFGTFLLGTLLLLGLDIVASVILVRELARRASLPKSQRVADGFARAESILPPLASLALSETFAPSVEDRHEELTRRYVEGEISEDTYERELQTLLGDGNEPATEPLEDIDSASLSDLETETESTGSADTDREREPARE
jgi:uncharacterized membrane protein